MDLQRGSTLGPYEIVMRLGAGGMGEVYRARDPRLGREVAIKVLLGGAAHDRDRLRRFTSEAKAASALNHPNILTVHEIGESAAGPYIVTELVDGSTVRELLADGSLPLERALDIAIQASEGMAKAHEAGIVHRDLKPENLMVTRDDPPALSEKGVAVPDTLSAVVRRALAKRPEDRHPGVRELGAELRSIRARLESSASATELAPTRPATPPRRRRVFPAAAAVVVLGGAAAVLLSRREPGMPGSVALPPNQLAVAVLPIANASGDAELERAGIGKILADALVQVLWEVPSLYVVSPVRVEAVSRSLGQPLAKAAGDPALARKVSEKSGASAMLTGSLSRVGGTYVLSANLTELASERLRGSFRGVTTTRDRLLTDLVDQVASGLRRQIAPDAPAGGVDRVATTDVRAYEHYVRGLEHNLTGNWRAAIPELEKAIALDPRMGLAWSELACAYSFAGENPRAEAAQKKAEESLDRVNRKERLWIEGNGVWIRTRSPGAFQKVYEKFIREFPDDRQGYFYMGLAEYYLGGNCKNALGWYEKAYALSPAYYPITNAIVDCHLKLNQSGRASASLRRYLSLPSTDADGRKRAQWRMDEVRKKAA